jgi:L-serine dehydratase
MNISALDLFTIGIGPSSSHTVGPMRAAEQFRRKIEGAACYDQVKRIGCDLYGSLAATGKGHGTDSAIVLGLLGERPESVMVDNVETLLGQCAQSKSLSWSADRSIAFDPKKDIAFKRHKPLPLHPNGMHFFVMNEHDANLVEEIVYSLGGGFIATEAEMQREPASAKSSL